MQGLKTHILKVQLRTCHNAFWDFLINEAYMHFCLRFWAKQILLFKTYQELWCCLMLFPCLEQNYAVNFFLNPIELPDIILFTTENQVDSSKPFQLMLWEIILLRLPQGKGQGWGTEEWDTEQIKSLCESLPSQIYEHSLIRA